MQVTDEMVEAALANLPNRHLMNKTGVRAALTAALAVQTQHGVEEYSHEDRIALAGCLSWDLNEISPEDVKGILERLRAEGYSLTRSALVDVPAVESEPVAWLVRDNDDEEFRVAFIEPDICWQKAPLYAHPPRSLSNEGWMPIESVPHNEEVFLGWFDMDGDWITEVGEGFWGWRNETANNISRHGSATHWQPLPTPPLSTRKGSAGDSSATDTKGSGE